MKRKELSKLRAAVGRKGAKARWSGRDGRATACLRVYPGDADEIRKRAKAARKLPADVVAEMVRV